MPCATRSRPSASARRSGPGSRWTPKCSTITWGARAVATHHLVDAPHDDVWDPAHRQAAEAAALGRTKVPLRLVGGTSRPPAGHSPWPTSTWTAPDLATRYGARRGDVMTAASPYEQLKNDLGYLQLARATECFATVAERAKDEDWSHVEYLAAVMAEQVAATSNRRLAARLRYARFPYVRSLEEFDYDFQPSVDRKLVEDLATLRFIEENRPVVFLGQPGCGKTHLAVALATRAVEAGYRGYFSSADAMVRVLPRGPQGRELRHQAAGLHRTRRSWSSTTSGLLPIDTEGAGVFFHVVNARYENGHPTLVTTNRGLPAWGDVFGDPVVAGAILDRLMHKAVVFNIKGPSWRIREHSALAEASKA